MRRNATTGDCSSACMAFLSYVRVPDGDWCLTGLRVSRAFGVGLKSRVRQPYQQLDLISFFPSSLEYLVRPLEHLGRDRQANLLRRFEIDYKLKLRRLLHWEVSRFRSFQNLVYVSGGAAVTISIVG